MPQEARSAWQRAVAADVDVCDRSADKSSVPLGYRQRVAADHMCINSLWEVVGVEVWF